MQTDVTLDLGHRASRRWGERVIALLLFGCGLISVLTTVGIVVVLVTEAAGFFREVPLAEFLTGTRWSPMYSEQHFGILPLLNGTLLIAAGSMLIALPVGLTSAIYLSEYATPKVRGIIKPILEVLAGIPTVVYGYFALTFITPILRLLFPETGIFNAAAGAIVVGIMIIPMVASLSEDALNAVLPLVRGTLDNMGDMGPVGAPLAKRLVFSRVSMAAPQMVMPAWSMRR